MKKFVEVFYQLHTYEPLQHKILDWEEGLTVSSVLKGLEDFQLNPQMNERQVGIYGKEVELSSLVQPGDRIEIYAPLQIDPKEARRLRVVKKKR